LQEGMFHAELSGISSLVELSTFVSSKLIDRRRGSLLWTHFGVSGPVEMDASRHWIVARARRQPVELRCNFFPGQSFAQVEKCLTGIGLSRWRVSVEKALAEFLPERLASALAHAAKIDPATPLSQLPRAHRRTLVQTLSNFLLPVERDRGWNFAEVTA